MLGRSGALAAALVAGLAATALAQDYTVTAATGLLETRPASATQLSISSGTGLGGSYALPFAFPYYGKTCSSVWADANGWLLPDSTTGIYQNSTLTQPHGQDATSGAFPYSSPGDADGIIAPLWSVYNYVNYGANTGYAYMWTTGTAPTRHVAFSWENCSIGYAANPRITVQCHLYESTGRIVFAYSTNASGYGSNSSYVCGVDSPIDARFTAPVGAAIHAPGYPGSDFVLDPRVATFTGTALFDKIVSGAGGIGGTQSGVPLSGVRVELRRTSDNYVYAGATTSAADGSFSITGLALPSSNGTLAVVAQTSAVAVRLSQGAAATSWPAASSLSFASSSSVGTRTLGASADALGDLRAAFNVAIDCGTARAWAVARTTDSIPQIDAYLDSSVSAATLYQKANGSTPASLRIGARQALNPDSWDDAVITHAYARHVLASIAGAPSTPYDDRFDAVTDTENAFAEGFGWYVWSAVSGSSTGIDGLNATTAVVHDLETPTITVTKGPNVAGCMAGALDDLLDSANETWDAVDGTLAPGRAFAVADAMTAAPTAASFLQAWVDAGFDAHAVTRTFVGNGVLADDALEPDDAGAEAPPLGIVGFVRKGLVLNRFDEDWCTVTLPFDAASLMADAKYDAATTGATIALEIRDAADALAATGTFVGAKGAMHAFTGAVPAGQYRVGVRHVAGGTVPVYSLQVYVPPSMDAAPIRDWTVGRPYDLPLGVTDGIAPFTLATVASSLPPGLALNPANLHAFGTPTQVGQFPLTVQLTDGGDPANVVARNETVTINASFRIALPDFVGFPAERPVDTVLPTTGGTPPLTLLVTSGALPAGLSFAPNTLHVTGTAPVGESQIGLGGVDAAGDSNYFVTRAVVAAQASGKNVPADLALGASACGWWFDAVAGSAVSFGVATTKGREKRALVGTLLAPDRSALSATIKATLGGLSGRKIVCPLSGRYYLIASGPNGGATRLLATIAAAPPKSGKGGSKSFAPDATTTIDVGALPGATLVLKFAGDKKTLLVGDVVSVVDPSGAAQSFAAFVKGSTTGGTLTMLLPTAGTWTITLGATSTTGSPGRLTWSYSIKQPKGVVYSAD